MAAAWNTHWDYFGCTAYVTIQRSLRARCVNAIQWHNTALGENKTKLRRNEVPKIRCCAAEALSSQPNNQTPEWHRSSRRRQSKQDSAPACSVWNSPDCKAHFCSTYAKISFNCLAESGGLWEPSCHGSMGAQLGKRSHERLLTKAASPWPSAQTRLDHTTTGAALEFPCFNPETPSPCSSVSKNSNISLLPGEGFGPISWKCHLAITCTTCLAMWSSELLWLWGCRYVHTQHEWAHMHTPACLGQQELLWKSDRSM